MMSARGTWSGLLGNVVAAAIALIANFPFRRRASSADDLERIRRHKDRWREAEWISARRVAGTRIEMLASYKRRKKSQAFLSMSAIALEVAAILSLAVAVAINLRSDSAKAATVVVAVAERSPRGLGFIGVTRPDSPEPQRQRQRHT